MSSTTRSVLSQAGGSFRSRLNGSRYGAEEKISSVPGRMGVATIPSGGVMTDREVRTQRLGGEALADVW